MFIHMKRSFVWNVHTIQTEIDFSNLCPKALTFYSKFKLFEMFVKLKFTA